MKRLSGYPSWFFWLLIVASAALVATGLLLCPGVVEYKLEWDIDWHLDSGWRLPVVALHALVGMLTLMLVGALWHVHMRAGWRKQLNRISGLATALSLCGLALTALGLYYLGSSQGQLWVSLLHTALGLIFALLLVWHGWHGSRIRANYHRPQGARVSLNSYLHSSSGT